MLLYCVGVDNRQIQGFLDLNAVLWHFWGWQNMCHCRSQRPSKFPFGPLTHDNISRLQFIVQTFVCMCACVKWRFSAKRWEHRFHQRKWLWKWVTSGLKPLIGWKCLSRLTQLPVSMNGAALWTNGRAVVRMQQWSRKKHPIVPGTLKKCDLPPAGSGCSALSEHLTDSIPHWQVWRTVDSRSITSAQFIIGLWVSDVVIFRKLSSKKMVPFQELNIWVFLHHCVTLAHCRMIYDNTLSLLCCRYRGNYIHLL